MIGKKKVFLRKTPQKWVCKVSLWDFERRRKKGKKKIRHMEKRIDNAEFEVGPWEWCDFFELKEVLEPCMDISNTFPHENWVSCLVPPNIANFRTILNVTVWKLLWINQKCSNFFALFFLSILNLPNSEVFPGFRWLFKKVLIRTRLLEFIRI